MSANGWIVSLRCANQGLNANIHDDSLLAPLDYALMSGHKDCVEVLLAAGAVPCYHPAGGDRRQAQSLQTLVETDNHTDLLAQVLPAVTSLTAVRVQRTDNGTLLHHAVAHQAGGVTHHRP